MAGIQSKLIHIGMLMPLHNIVGIWCECGCHEAAIMDGILKVQNARKFLEDIKVDTQRRELWVNTTKSRGPVRRWNQRRIKENRKMVEEIEKFIQEHSESFALDAL